MNISNASRRILVLRYRFIGDTILTVPFLRNLRRAYPDAYIAWVVAPGSSDIVRGIPYVDELIYWDPVTIHADSRGAHRTLSAKIAFIRELRSKKFDKAYILKRSLSSAVMAYLSGARERIGFATEGRGLLLTKRIPYRHDQHEVRNFLAVLEADGIPVVDECLELWPTPEEKAVAADIVTSAVISPAEGIVALHPFSAVTERGWPLENFAQLATILAEKGYRPAVLGGPRDKDAFSNLSHLFPPSTLDLVGRCSLRTTAAFLRSCQLFVGNDSGIMHLAAAADIPLVALFGPQSPIKFGPWSKKARVLYAGFPCSPCRQKFFRECTPSPRMRPACIEAITVDQVMDACREALSFGDAGK